MDPDGKIFIPPQAIIAGAGFLIGAGTSFIGQLITNSFDFKSISYKEVLIDGLSGSASAFLAVTGVGAWGQIVGNASIGYLSEYVKQITNSSSEIDGVDLLASTITGGVAGLVGGAGNKELSRQTNRLFNKIKNAIKHDDYKAIGKAISYYDKHTKTLTKETVKDMLRAILPDTVQEEVINKVIEGIEE